MSLAKTSPRTGYC